jgi:copper transport protein
MTLTPGRAGPVSIVLGFQTGGFEELALLEVELTFVMPAAGIEPIRIEARVGEDGLWRAGPLTLPTPGEWEVSVQILITDFESLTLRNTITLEP